MKAAFNYITNLVFISCRGRLLPVVLCFIFSKYVCYAQDPQFSQFFAAPILLNPAFTGNMEFDCKQKSGQVKAMLNSRNQWGNFRTDAFAADYFNKKKQIGLGVVFQSHRISGTRFMSNEVGIAGSYRLTVNDDWNFNSGLQLSLGSRSVGFNNLRFTDQFSEDGYNGNITKDNEQNTPVIFYPDISTGGVIYNRTTWAGLSLHHLNRPNVSNLQNIHRLPVRISLHGGHTFWLNKSRLYSSYKKEISVKPTVQIRNRGPFFMMDVGSYYTFEPIVVGLWYRGVPLGKGGADNKPNQDAVVFMIGYKSNGIRFGYSYDLSMHRSGMYNGGSHEISLAYQKVSDKCKKRRYGAAMPIPGF
jgi:type IX secretion system PorP/SprF family membrane protein